MPLTFFDTATGETRDLTQADLDMLVVIRWSHGRLLNFFREERERLENELRAVDARHAQPPKEVENG
jgi:hypothetical protein